MEKTLRERILETLEDLPTPEMVAIHNEYCDEIKYYEDQIYFVSDINDLYYGISPIEILNRLGGIRTSDTYFIEGIYGAESFDYYCDCPTTYYGEIAKYCADNETSLYSAQIQETIDEYLEEIEDE